MPIDPPPNAWDFPDPTGAPGDLVAVGGDVEPGSLLAAYRRGLFPMPDPGARRRQRIAWFSPDPRGILPLDALRISRSLRRSVRRYRIAHDERFAEVMRACADAGRPGAWITPTFVEAYSRLHELGHACSVEVYDDRGELVGGLYGVRIERFFAGESMFHTATDASKVALIALIERLCAEGGELLDVQWLTPHLASLGAVEVPRSEYLRRLASAIAPTTGGVTTGGASTLQP